MTQTTRTSDNKTEVKRTVGCSVDTTDTCETYAMEKQASQPVPNNVRNKAKKARELIYSDNLGLCEVACFKWTKYAVTFIEYTKFAVVKYM